ncbi:hypothetical protein COU62_03965 [Candidatus Pacearchaeota archaeon CG10_big_fil_rev_8_21_14_0_10_35_219]|nr:glycosyltransferase family 9 protein [Candidatus Pacearchaeota archaeon]PIO07506.1 MAG: hypothetical protein COU62_03965 [Candidatus Pacearchaeota archaeon CG10_big_fil_rev_8_21_14_0_10_35_219]
MKLGPKLRKKSTELHEFIRKASVFIDYFLWLLLDPSKYTIIKTNKIKKILVVLVNPEMGNVGGDFCALGVVNYFKKVYPSVNVSFLLDKKTKSHFGEIPGIEMIEHKGRRALDILKKNAPDAALFISLGPFKLKDFLFVKYRVVTFYPSIRGLLVYKNKLHITRKPFTLWGTHMVEFGFKMFESLGFKFPRKDVIIYYSKKEENKVDNFLKKKRIKKYIVMHPGGKHVVKTLKGGKWPPHLWPVDRYAKVANHFSKKGYNILVTGTKEESYLAEKIQEKTKSKIYDVCGLFSIRELAPLLKKSELLIATDTSIVHIAYQVKAKIVELFGPSYAKAVGAWPLNSKRHKILIDGGPCARSMRKIFCPENIVCLDRISVREVIDSSEKLLDISFKKTSFLG